MNKDILEGNWNEIKGKIKEHFGKLTDDELTQIKGKRDVLIGKLQAKYGYNREKAEEELTKFLKSTKAGESGVQGKGSQGKEKAFSGGFEKGSSHQRGSGQEDRANRSGNKPHNDNW